MGRLQLLMRLSRKRKQHSDLQTFAQDGYDLFIS